MATTVSVAPRDPARPQTTTEDLDGRLVDGVEALRQRIVEAIRFRFQTWMLNRNAGLNYDLIIGHRIPPALAASVLNNVILEEGGDEVTGLTDIHYSLDRSNRVFNYSVRVDTIYGDLPVSQRFG